MHPRILLPTVAAHSFGVGLLNCKPVRASCWALSRNLLSRLPVCRGRTSLIISNKAIARHRPMPSASLFEADMPLTAALALPAGAVPMGLAAWAFEMEACPQGQKSPQLDEGVERIIERLQSLKKPVFGLEGRGSVIRPFNSTATSCCPTSPRSGLDLLAEILAEHITPAVEPVESATTKALSLVFTGPHDPMGRPILDGLSRGAPQSKAAYVEPHPATHMAAQPKALRVGNCVQIHGLQRGSRYNGTTGTIRAILDNEKLGVELVVDGMTLSGVISVKAENLLFLDTGTAVEDTKVWLSAKQLCEQQQKRLQDAKARGERYQQQETQLAEWFGRWWGRDTEHLEGQSLAPAPAGATVAPVAGAAVAGAAVAGGKAAVIAVVAASIEYAPRWWEFKDHSVEQRVAPPLTEMFKLKPGEWDCKVCMTRNTTAAKVKCASCSAFRFGASAALNRRGASLCDVFSLAAGAPSPEGVAAEEGPFVHIFAAAA